VKYVLKMTASKSEATEAIVACGVELIKAFTQSYDEWLYWEKRVTEETGKTPPATPDEIAKLHDFSEWNSGQTTSYRRSKEILINKLAVLFSVKPEYLADAILDREISEELAEANKSTETDR
jgi:hypothetical protein